MTEDQIKHMVDRFLSWKLPENFNPDGGISFRRTFNEHTEHPSVRQPTGTNLLDAQQVTAMVRYMVEDLAVAALSDASAADDVRTCPFCGSVPITDEEMGLIACHSDDCVGPSIHGATFDEAMQFWNKRTAARLPAECTCPQWRCFFCDEVFTDEAAAQIHFGLDEEWTAGCIDPLTKDEKERRADQVQMYIELDGERERSASFQDKAYLLGHWEDDLRRHFNGAKSVNQAMLMFDAMEGRALAAEEKLAQAAPAIAIASIPGHVYWLMAKGRTRPSEPLYGVQLIDPESGVAIVSAEAEELAGAINTAVEQLPTSRQPEA